MPGERHVPRREGRGTDKPEGRVDREITQPAKMVRLVIRRALSPKRAETGRRPSPETGVRLRIVERPAAKHQSRPLAELPKGEAHGGLQRGAGTVVKAQVGRHVRKERGRVKHRKKSHAGWVGGREKRKGGGSGSLRP